MQEKYKNHIKTILLFFLIALSFLLVVRVWSVGYYFEESIDDVKNYIKSPIVRILHLNQNNVSKNMSAVLRPERIVLNEADKRAVLYDGHIYYEKLFDASIEFISDLEYGNSRITDVENVSEYEYQMAAKNRSILIDYGTECSYKLFSVLTGADAKSVLSENLSTVREFIIRMPLESAKTLTLFVKNYSDGTIYKYTIKRNATEFDEILSEVLEGVSQEDRVPYSFELDFHKTTNADGTSSKVVFDPLLSVELFPDEKPTIKPIRYNAIENAELINEEDILSLFDINANSVRTYIDIDGTKVYVENEATLRLSPEGFVEYSVLEKGSGIRISRSSSAQKFDISAAASCLADFTAAISELLPKTSGSTLHMTGNLKDDEKGTSYTLCYNYYLDGVPIYSLDKKTNMPTNTITATVNNGYLKYYKNYISTYEYTENKSVCDSMISAADASIASIDMQKEQTLINKANTCYVDDNDTELKAQWIFSYEGKDGIFK